MRTFLTCSVVLICYTVMAQPVQNDSVPLASPQQSTAVAKPSTKKIASLPERFAVFTPLAEHEIYSLTIAADVPDNARPHKVYVNKEPGHVFVILEQKDTLAGTARAQVWGFYPVRPISSVFMRNVRCQLNDNGGRIYDAAITIQLDASQFEMLKEKAQELAKKRYNLNKFNCYDYAIELFNSVSVDAPLPVTHVKFPFIVGRGGSPCGLYSDLKKLQAGGRTGIHIGAGIAPLSSQPVASYDIANQSTITINH
jgi:hypothetical protein